MILFLGIAIGLTQMMYGLDAFGHIGVGEIA